MYTSFMNNQVPALWTRVSFASLKSLASWNKDLLFRWDTSVTKFSVLLSVLSGLQQGDQGTDDVPSFPDSLAKTLFRSIRSITLPKRAVQARVRQKNHDAMKIPRVLCHAHHRGDVGRIGRTRVLGLLPLQT